MAVTRYLPLLLSSISQAYKRKTEAAKKEYLKALAAYRASLVSKGFPHIQSEYQNNVGSQSPGSSNPAGGQNQEWDNEYCNRECGVNHCSMLPRDKPLYLT
ncbi:UNVERIFIED_CONTAM: hypothetical protein FKN15_051080 [Acipenser sinensis]